MSNLVPPWFEVTGTSLDVGEAVLPAGKQTLPKLQTEAEGGDPDNWWTSATHAALASLNVDTNVTIGITGTYSVDWTRVQINESGDAASCAKRITLTTGREGTVEYEFSHPITIPKKPCLQIAVGYGNLGNVAGGVNPTPETDTLNITDNSVGTALCSSTGCTSGDFGDYDDDGTGDLIADNVDAATFTEKFARATRNTYVYQMTGQARVELSEGGTVFAYFYTGAFDWARWGGEPVELSDDDYTLSAEAGIGTIRGVAVKAKYLTYNHDHANSLVSGSPGNCPLPVYSSDVTTGTSSADISVTIG